MKDTAPPAGTAGVPEFATLAADPEIAPLLRFDPVVRKVRRPDGWTAELQKELIARIAAAGTLQQAVWQMGKHATGAEALYKTPSADSFRAAWDAAVIIGRRRNGLDSRPPHSGEVPGITRRGHKPLPPDDEDPVEPDIDQEEKIRLLENIAGKFLKKVAAERRARLGGEIVAADFYLRQVTMLEVTFDLTASAFGWDARELLRELRRGKHSLMDIVDTPFADFLDTRRRIWWLQEGDPERPPHPDPRFTIQHRTAEGDCTTYADQNATGATTAPARGYTCKDEIASSRT